MKLIKRTRLKIRPHETTFYRPDAAQESLHMRLSILGVVIVVCFALLFARLWFLQIVGGKDYRKKAEGNRIREIALEAPRGSILDRNGRILVRNKNSLTISVVPAEISNEPGVIGRLSRLLKMGEKEIRYKIEKSQAPNQRAVLIKRNVGEEIITYVREHQREFPGVIAGTMPMRDYPFHETAAHLIGYLGEISPEILKRKKTRGYKAGDQIGLTGVECVYDEELRGTAGKYRIEVDAAGNAVKVLSRIEPRSGLDLRLSIDLDIQKTVEDALKAQIEIARSRRHSETGKNYAASGASAVVLNPKNGEIIAMASEPSFDLNEFVEGINEKEWKELNDPKNNYPLNNRAIMSEIPPGSTFKVVTAIAGMSEGLFNISSPFFCSHVFTKGAFKEFPKYCWGKHSGVNLFNGIVQSCDIVFYEIGYTFYQRQIHEVGRSLWEYASKFQLGKKTGIDLVSEMDGRVPTPEWKKEFNRGNPPFQVWYPGDTVNMAIGQGDLLTTPLQIACVYAAFANRGKIYKPHLMKNLEDEDGKVVKRARETVMTEVDLDPSFFETIEKALQGVVRGRGTAGPTFEGFPLDAIPVAGKTGTSEIVGKQPTAWFACYAPVGDPKYVVVVAIEEGGHGGESAAPVARRILEKLFDIQSEGEIRPSVGD